VLGQFAGFEPERLYDLSPAEFERLVLDLLPGLGYSEIQAIPQKGHAGLDAIATIDGMRMGVQVHHKVRMDLLQIQRLTESYFADPMSPPGLLFVTSAALPEAVHALEGQAPSSRTLRLMGREDVLKAVSHREGGIPERMVVDAGKRKRRLRLDFIVAIIGVVVSLAGLGSSMYSWLAPQPTLDQRIQNVDKATARIHDLESYLSKVKGDMLETQRESASIRQEYQQAQELQKLSDSQLAAVATALRKQTWWDQLTNYGFAFILGVASSLLASVMHRTWRKWASLR
jgi:hypothetical protein